MQSRALRVGVLINDNLVEERVFRGSEPVTIGQSLRCALSLPVDGLPAEHTLFVRDQGQTLVRITADMECRLAGPGSEDAIRSELRVGPGDRGVWTIPLERGARGKLMLGDATILFQEIAAPPIAPRPRLPAAVRGSLADRIDPRLAVIVGASVFVHLAIATWAWLVDREIETDPVASAMQPYRQDVFENVTLPDEPPAPVGEPGVAAPVSQRQTPRPVVPRPDPAMSATDADRYAQILTGADEQHGGTTAMRDRGPAADLNQQIRDIREENRHVQIGNPPPGRSGTERIGIGPHPTFDNPELAQLPTHREEPRDGRITPVPDPHPQPIGNTLTAAMVLQKIKSAYLPGLQRCYKKGLVHDGALAGKVAISFTVDEQGRLTEPAASGMTTEVDSCVRAFMPTWRFSFPRDKDGDPTDAQFALSLALQPS